MTPLDLPLILITNTVPQDELAPIDYIAQVVMGPSNGNLMDRPDVLRLAPRLTGIVNQSEPLVDWVVHWRKTNWLLKNSMASGTIRALPHMMEDLPNGRN